MTARRWYVLALLLVAALSLLGYLWQHDHFSVAVAPAPESEAVAEVVPVSPTDQETPLTTSLPASVLLTVPFTAQAPLGLWDEIHEEACEEASLLMLRAFLSNTGLGAPSAVESEIQAFTAWQTAHGYGYDLTIAQLKAAAEAYYRLNSGRIVTDLTTEKIKAELAANRPMIVPAAGQLLGNPHFTAPGPRYHMLVVVGYDGDEFITNDPGTRFGKNYRYSASTLLRAIHDLTPGDIATGAQVGLVYDTP